MFNVRVSSVGGVALYSPPNTTSLSPCSLVVLCTNLSDITSMVNSRSDRVTCLATVSVLQRHCPTPPSFKYPPLSSSSFFVTTMSQHPPKKPQPYSAQSSSTPSAYTPPHAHAVHHPTNRPIPSTHAIVPKAPTHAPHPIANMLARFTGQQPPKEPLVRSPPRWISPTKISVLACHSRQRPTRAPSRFLPSVRSLPTPALPLGFRTARGRS